MPEPRRIPDINEKLLHVSRERQRLASMLFDAALNEGDSVQVRSIVADILGNTRKCFDYAARDIVENVMRYDRDIHFPFWRKQLQKEPWKKVIAASETINTVMESLITKAERDTVIDHTLFKYSIPGLINTLCIEDKHLNGLSATYGPDEDLYIDMPGMKVVLPMNQFDPGIQTNASGPVKKRIVKSFQIDKTKDEVKKFCLYAEGSTRYILSEIYTQAFGMPRAIQKEM